MNCKKCGSPLSAEDKFCRNCGATVGEENAQAPQDSSVNNNRFIFDDQNNNNNVQNNGNNLNYAAPMNNGNNYAQPMNNNMNYNQNNNTTRNIIFIVIGVILVIIIAVLATVAIMKYVGKSDSGKNPDVGGNTTGTTGIPTTTTPTSSYKVVYDNVTFTIPDDMEYSITEDFLLIGDVDETWAIGLAVIGDSYNTLKANRFAIQNNFITGGLSASSPEIKTLSGQEYLTYEVSLAGENAIYAYTQLDYSHTIAIFAVNQNYQFDYKILETITPVIKSAKYGNSASNMESNISDIFDYIDFEEISKIDQ